MEDLIMSVIMIDYCDSQLFDFSVDTIDKKMKQYTDYQKIQFSDANLKLIVNNNIAALRCMHKNEHYTDSLHKIDEYLKGTFKQTK